jgi:hypothetical protein
MALSKTITLDIGVTVEYWVIISSYYDKINGITKVVIMPYVSKEIRDTGIIKYIRDFNKNYDFPGYVTIPEAYELIKASLNDNSYFSDATDC